MTDHRPRLRRMMALRIDRRLQGRVDPSDVIQEALIDAARRLPEYAKNPSMPFYLWLRFLTGQRLMEQHRRHLGAGPRRRPRDFALSRRISRKRRPPTWRPISWASSAPPARPRSASNKRFACRRRSTRWSRSTARSWPCGTSSSSSNGEAAEVLEPRQVGRQQTLHSRTGAIEGCAAGDAGLRFAGALALTRSAISPWPTNPPPTAIRSSNWPIRS